MRTNTLVTIADNDGRFATGTAGQPAEDPDVVVVVGPSPRAIGGMAGVVGLMESLQFGPHWRVESFCTTESPGESEQLFGRVFRHVRHLARLRRTLRDVSASVVHIHTCSGMSFYRSAADMLVAQRLGCRVVLHIHGAAFDAFFEHAGFLGRRAIRWILTRADGVIALSTSWQRKLAMMAPAARLTVVENACRIATVLPARTHDGPCRFLLLAKMDSWKGIDDLLEACAALRAERYTFELILAGPPGSAGDALVLNEKIFAHGVESSVRYVGPAMGAEKSRLLGWADACVQPSHAEGMPLSLLEALAHRLPIVATTVGAVPEVITTEVEGLLVPPQRPDRLAVAMARLIRDRSLRNRLAESGAQLAATRFSAERFRDDLVALYDGLNRCDSRVSRPRAVPNSTVARPVAASSIGESPVPDQVL